MIGLVKIPVADLRREPSFNSELVSQALFNTSVELGEEDDKYISVVLPDGYRGWIYKNHLSCPVGEVAPANQLKVVQPFLPVYSSDKKTKVSILSFSSSLRVFKKSGSWLTVGSSESILGWAKKDGLVEPKKAGFSITALITKGLEFLGTPYLWGGISSFGFDCSGFLFTLFDCFDKTIPRDTSDQVKMGDEVPFAKIKPGDLLFFPGHVALYAGKNEILHANLRGGGVTLDSIKRGGKDYNPVIEKLICARRVG